MEKWATLRVAMALATDSAPAGIPPPRSPDARLNRRGTLQSLLFPRLQRRDDPSDRKDGARDPPAAGAGSKHKLKDLLLLSPPLDGPASERRAETRRRSSMEAEVVGVTSRRLRPAAGSFRRRMVRRAWRPVLVTIPE